MNYLTIQKLGQSISCDTELNHLTLDDQRQHLGHAIYLLRREAKELRDAIVDSLTFKQYQRWDKRPENLSAITKNSKLIAKAERIVEIWTKISDLEIRYDVVLCQLATRPSLQLIESKSYSWYELRIRRINKQANTRNRSANQTDLRIVS